MSYARFETSATTFIQKLHSVDLQNPSFKGCTIAESTILKESENESIEFHLLEKKIITFNWGIAFQRSSFLSPIFRTKIDQLVTAGLYDEWYRMISEKRKLFRKKQPKPYDTVLTLQHLSIGFYIWLLMCLLSTCAFLGELLTYWGPKVSRMLFFNYILSTFYKMQKSMH